MNNINLSTERYNKFWSLVLIPKDYENLCWKWIGRKDKDGYGLFSLNGNKRAHRLSYMMYNEQINSKQLVCHSCDNPPCVSPYHLWIGDNKSNIIDRDNKRRHNCGTGHHESIMTNDQIKQILFDIANNKLKNFNQIYQLFGVKRHYIEFILNRKAWKHITDQYSEKELANIKSKLIKRELTEDEVRQIKIKLLVNKESCKSVAEQFNKSPNLMSNIKNGKVWNHITI